MATKIHRLTADGGVETVAFGDAYFYSYVRFEASNIDEVAQRLQRLQRERKTFVVRGRLLPSANRRHTYRLLHPKPDRPATFEKAARAWIMVDVDEAVDCPEGLDHIADPGAAAAHVVTMLPDEFKGASYIWQASSSYGLERYGGGPAVLKFHLFFLLDREVSEADLRRWGNTWNDKVGFKLVDVSVFGAIQPNYTAAPIFQGLADPIAGRRMGVYRGGFERVALVLPPEVVTKPSRRKAEGGEALPEDARADDTGTSKARGYLAHLDRIGVPNYRYPIFSAMMSYFSHNGVDAPVGPLKRDIRARIDAAPSAGRSVQELTRYKSDEYLDPDIRSARAKLAKPKANLPAYYPAPTEDRDSALARQRRVIAEWFTDAARLETANRRLEVLKAGFAEGDGFNTPTAAQKAAHTRKVTPGIVKDAGYAGDRLPDGRRLLITGAQGSGKSRAAAEEIAAWPIRESVIWWTVPTITKADEQAAEYTAIRRDDSPPVMVVRGRGQEDPATDELMCLRDAAARLVTAAGQSPGEVLCPVCPHRGSCGYKRQSAEINLYGKRGLYLMSMEYLFQIGPAPSPDLIIADESVIGAAAEELAISCHAVEDVAERLGLGVLERIGKELMCDPAGALARIAGCCSVEEIKAAVRALQAEAKRESELIAITGHMSDTEILDAVDHYMSRELSRVRGLLEAVLLELPHSPTRSSFNAIWYNPRHRKRETEYPAYIVHRLRELKPARGKPVLLLDGTGELGLNRAVWGDRVELAHIPVERRAEVVGTIGKEYSKQSLTGTDRRGKPMGDKVADAAKLRSEIAGIAGKIDGRVFCGSTLKVEKVLAEVLPVGVMTGHFGAVRGINAWEACESALVIGREQPAPQAVERQARAFLAEDPEPLLSVCDYVRQTRGRRMRDGTVLPVEVLVHPDPRVQAILEQIREAELCQTIDRVRPIYNDRRIFALNNLTLDLTYDRVVSHAQLVAGGDRWQRAWRLNGVMPTSTADLSAAYPVIWPDAKSAENYIIRDRINYPHSPKESLIWEMRVIKLAKALGETATPYRYRKKGKRGPAPTVWVSSRHPDPRAAVESILGELSLFEPVEAESINNATYEPITIKLCGGSVELSGSPVELLAMVAGADPVARDAAIMALI
ncbi:hypothetical protein A6A04_12345 [Paramagnetospirillum marisnigri]|uniref:RepB-like DNA primase domain-containing protein n=1 Tax=Paramagnetospirillum marisnigri TaxID=1285242 RepID=A0A178MVC3_9PROT|nr:hypothetical protein A6A04_12345 [Paramagnetospirillum marisnigri]